MEQGIVKPKSQRYKRLLEERESKVFENDKKALIIRGAVTSEVVRNILKEFYILKKPNATLFWKKNAMIPFEDTSSLEFLTKRNDTSLFAFGSHSKKRPHNIVLGRMYDFQVLDMIELGVENYESLKAVKGEKCTLGTKPCLIFSGAAFETDNELRRLKSLLMDFFRGPVVNNVRLNGMEHVIQFSATETEVQMRSYKIALKKSGTRTPRIELEDMGPNIDFVVRRTRLASHDLYKQACKVAKGAKPKKHKNVSMDVFGTKHGRVHMQSQDINTIQLRKVKALKRKFDPKPEGEVPSKNSKAGSESNE